MASTKSLLLAVLLVAGCSPDKSSEPCGPREPAFAVQVTAGGAALPDDTRIRVKYNGNLVESYRLSEPKRNADVCCQASAEPVSGGLPRVSCATAMEARDGGTASAIQCTLWTSGPAEVFVFAEGYEDLFRNLNTRLKEDEKCGVETVEAQLHLGRAEGGI